MDKAPIRSLRPVAVALAALMAAGGALADATGSASLTGLTFNLYDLDPADGVAPSIEFLSGPPDRIALVAQVLDDESDRQVSGTGPLSPLSLATQVGSAATASATLAGTLSAGDLAIHADSAARSTAGTAYSHGENTGTSETRVDLDFTLSPSTLLVVTAHGQTGATAGDDAPSAGTGLMELTLSAYGQRADQELTTQATQAYPGGYSPTGGVMDFGLSITSGPTLPVTGEFVADVRTFAYGRITPVPEPAGAPLALAGVGVLALRFARRGAGLPSCAGKGLP